MRLAPEYSVVRGASARSVLVWWCGGHRLGAGVGVMMASACDGVMRGRRHAACGRVVGAMACGGVVKMSAGGGVAEASARGGVMGASAHGGVVGASA